MLPKPAAKSAPLDTASVAAPAPAAGIRRAALDRRSFLALAGAAGLAITPLSRALAQEVEATGALDAATLARAEAVSGLAFSDEERELMLEGLAEQLDDFRALRAVGVPNDVPPAFRFDPRLPGMTVADAGQPAAAGGGSGGVIAPSPHRPRSRREDEAATAEAEPLAFATLAELAEALRQRRVRSVDLTGMYLDRLRRWDPVLECVVTLTEERALEAAEAADRQLDAGDPRGPLHGIPWGAKDLFAVAGYPTTWGAQPYREQRFEADAAVVRRLDTAGAVLVAKLTLGALAWGDVWFGGTTRNPWNVEQGSSGSSAGSAAATAAGLVGFTLGTETWGSIVSPCTRVGASGLRPTFGRVSREGAMALSWTMDKVGPICRSADDCGLVFAAIHGTEGAQFSGAVDADPSVINAPFGDWRQRSTEGMRVGYVPALFEEEREEAADWRGFDQATLEVLRGLGVELVPMALPDDLPISSLGFLLSAEAAAAFDDLTLSNRDDELVRQVAQAWPNVFRQARMVPAVEYIQANRVRTLLMRRWDEMLDGLDAYVIPSFGGDNLLATNLTGHPAVVVPNGFRDNGTPTSITFQGHLFDEAAPLALACAYQSATDFHRRHPDLPAQERRKAELAKEEAEAEAGQGS